MNKVLENRLNIFIEDETRLFENQFYIKKSGRSSVVYQYTNNELKKTKLRDKYPNGLVPSDVYQNLALETLYNLNEVKMLVLLGQAGTGKTFITLANIMYRLEKCEINKVFFIKPLVGINKSKYMGALPGGLDEKVSPFLESFYDVAYSLDKKFLLDELLYSKAIEFVPLDFIRGRNLDHCVVVIDESQNLDKHDFLATLTRVGKNANVILLGDPTPQQNDIRKESGLVCMINDERFWSSSATACYMLKKRMRNPIVELVEEIILSE